jgi:hypothetical protein
MHMPRHTRTTDKLLQGCEQIRIHGPTRQAYLACGTNLRARRHALAHPPGADHDPQGELVLFNLQVGGVSSLSPGAVYQC